MQKVRHGSSDCGPTLISWVQEQQKRNPNNILTIVFINLEEYLRYRYSWNSKLKAVNGLLLQPVDKTITRPFVLSSQKSQSQKKLLEAVTGKNGERMKKRRKKCGIEILSEVSQVEIEEVGWTGMSKMNPKKIKCYSMSLRRKTINLPALGNPLIYS